MVHKFHEIAFTDGVKALQAELGSRGSYARFEADDVERNTALGQREAQFIGSRDSFYMASVSETGWPYVQHRGGHPGFVQVLDERTIGFQDYRGNRQYVSVGNFRNDDRVSLFFMDYPRKARLKLFGRARAVGLDASQMQAFSSDSNENEGPPVERGIVIKVEAFDWNCPKYINERFTLAEIESAMAPLRARIADLETKLAAAGQE